MDEHSRLRQAWQSRIPEPLASHTHPVRYAAGLLFVHADTPAWASRLRHEQPALIARLRANPTFRDLADIRFRVSPRESPIPAGRAPVRPSRLSKRAASVVRQAAATIADPSLRAALERLAGAADDAPTTKRRS